MNISLPGSLKSFVDEQVAGRGYGTSSEYIRELIHRHQDRLNLVGYCSMVLLPHKPTRPTLATSPICVTGFVVNPPSEQPAGHSTSTGTQRRRGGDRVLCNGGWADVAHAFGDAFQAAYALIGAHPETGLLRFAYELALPHLRSVGLKKYPYLVFYRQQADHIDVWRVLDKP